MVFKEKFISATNDYFELDENSLDYDNYIKGGIFVLDYNSIKTYSLKTFIQFIVYLLFFSICNI